MVGASLRGIPASYNSKRGLSEKFSYIPAKAAVSCSFSLFLHVDFHFRCRDDRMAARIAGERGGNPRIYLQLSKGEATTSANAAVVLDGRASHNRAQLVNWTGSNSSGLGETGLTTAVLTAGLYRAKKSDCQSLHGSHKNLVSKSIRSHPS